MTMKFYHWKHPKLLLWRTRGQNQWLTFPQSNEDKAYGCFTRFPVSEYSLGLLYIMISIAIHSGQTTNELRLQPLILPSTDHTGNLGDSQVQSWGPRRLTCLNLPRDLVVGRLSHLNLLGDLPVQGSQEIDTRRPVQGPNSWEADMSQPAQEFGLPVVVMPQTAWGSEHWPEDAQLSVCNSTG